MKTLLIGADGQLGTDIVKVFGERELILLTIRDLDITKGDQIERAFEKHSPGLVINTAAYNKVDECEKEDALAYSVNATGAKNLAIACSKAGAILVHYSTDYVFDGDKGSAYSENDPPNPKSAYGISKLAGEFFVRYILPEHFIIRTSSLFGAAGCLGKGGGNFVETMLRIGREAGHARVVGDQVVSPTYTRDLAEKTAELVSGDKYGIYHITNSGECSWHGFAKKIFELTGVKVDLKSTTSQEFRAAAHRPKYSVLSHQGLKRAGIKDMRPWEEALKAYLVEKGHLRG